MTQDLVFALKPAAVSETVNVVAESSPIFSSGRTGAATSVTREDLATLPTISGRLTDITRLSPQYGGNGSFAGQDNRANNITIDGSYFNGSFGLQTTTGGVGDRTGVAPVSLEVIEQVQVNVAPYDVRQGNFVGANVNTVTRSGANQFTGSVYTRYRNESFVGTEANGQTFNPGTFKTTDTGEWVGGPIIKNKFFFFQSWESQSDTRPLTTFRANQGGEPVAGNVTRVNASDLTALSSYLSTNFKYDTGPFDNISKKTPGKPWMLKFDYNINATNKIRFRYNQLNSSTDVGQNGSGALGVTRRTGTTDFLSFQNSNYAILENVKSGIGEWNSVFGKWTNTLLIGDTFQDESRADIALFPFVVIGDGAGGVLTSFGSEPFTPYNLLRYPTFQAQDSVTKYMGNHSLTFGGAVEKFHSDNSFYFGIQSCVLVCDARGFLRRRQRLRRQPESHDVARQPGHLPGQVPAAAWPDHAAAAAARCSLLERLRPGRMAPAHELHPDGRPPRGRAAIRRHGVLQPGRRLAHVPRSGRFDRSIPVGTASRNEHRTGRRARASIGTSSRTVRRRCAAAPDSSRASRRTSGFRTRSATPVCCSVSSTAGTPPRIRSTRVPTSTSPRRPAPPRQATSLTSRTRGTASRRRGVTISARIAGCRWGSSPPAISSTTRISTRRST